jgi:hypothetical protein
VWAAASESGGATWDCGLVESRWDEMRVGQGF